MIHIGEIIRLEVVSQRLTQKEFGALIHKNEKTVPDIYLRASISIDLLIIISKALNKDFINVYYNEEPMKSLHSPEREKMNNLLQKFTEENKLLRGELALTKNELAMTINLLESQKENISYAKNLIEQHKLKINPA